LEACGSQITLTAESRTSWDDCAPFTMRQCGPLKILISEPECQITIINAKMDLIFDLEDKSSISFLMFMLEMLISSTSPQGVPRMNRIV